MVPKACLPACLEASPFRTQVNIEMIEPASEHWGPDVPYLHSMFWAPTGRQTPVHVRSTCRHPALVMIMMLRTTRTLRLKDIYSLGDDRFDRPWRQIVAISHWQLGRPANLLNVCMHALQNL